MKIALIAPSPVPFVIGGAENLWAGWLAALNEQPGVEAELIKLPTPERNFWEIVASYRQFAALDVLHFDRIITTKYPAWMVQHPDHHVFMQHKLRGLYDTWPAALATELPALLPPEVSHLLQVLERSSQSRSSLEAIFSALSELQAVSPGLPPELFALPGALIRRVVHALDGIGLARTAVRRYAAISATVVARPDYFPAGLAPDEVQVLHHPTLIRTLPAVGSPKVPAGAIIFTASRLDAPKRMDLVLQAYLQANLSVPLVVAGDGPQRLRLEQLAQDHPNVHLVGRLTDAELASAYQQALFVPFVPDREDYGLVTLEALQAGKPVLTCLDAGGVTELVQHNVNGLITEPNASALTAAMQRLATDATLRTRLAAQAVASVAHIHWSTLARAFCTPYPKVAVINTFAIYPPRNGGQLRMFKLYVELARHCDVRVVNLGPASATPAPAVRVHHLAPGLQEVVVPMTPEHAAAEHALALELRASSADLAAMLHPELSPNWLEHIADACKWADIVVACHPYAYPAIRRVWSGPVVYESLNVEVDLKAAIFGHAPSRVDQVRAVERACAAQAPLVLCCSAEDAARMQQLHSLPKSPTVVSNGVDVRAYPALDAASKTGLRQRLGLTNQPVALFVGSLHTPNIEALLALMPVARACPGVLFVAVGSVCEAPELSAADVTPANVRLVGRVSDAELRVWLAVAQVGLNPMVSGSGTNLKMLEYAAAGLPMLSTPFGGRGGLLHAGAHFVAAEISQFASALTLLLAPQHAAATRAQVQAAHQRVLQLGDWRLIAQAMWVAMEAHLPQRVKT